MRRLPAVVLLLLLSIPAASQEPQGKLIEEEWGILTIRPPNVEEGVRAGYTHIARYARKAADGTDLVETVEQSRIALKRMKVALEVSSDSRHVETAAGRPVSLYARVSQSSSPTVTEGAIEKGKLRLKIVSGGKETSQELEWPEDAILSEGGRLLSLKQGFAAGTTYSFRTFATDQGQMDTMTVSVLEAEKRTVQGRERALVKTLTTSANNPAIKVHTWVDDKGNAWLSQIEAMGMVIGIERTSKEEALKNASGEMPEIFFGSMPRSNVALPRPRDISSLTLHLERPDDGFAEWRPPVSTTEVLSREGRTITIRVTSAPPASPARLPLAVEGEILEFVRPSPSVQSDDPGIAGKAKEIVGKETDSMKAASALAGWVFKHIQKKSMDVAAASAKEVFETQKGDCSEHAVLLTAMLRAAGIPAKVCTGYVYVRGQWGGHAWSSAWVGKWVDLDATIGEGPADAARIKFGETQPEELKGLTEGMKGSSFMHGGMKVRVLEYVLDGKAVKVGATAMVDGNLFKAEALGVSFEKPPGWSWVDSKELPPLVMGVMRLEKSEIRVNYVDLPPEMAPWKTEKLAEKLGLDFGDEAKIAGLEAFVADDGAVLRLSRGELLHFEFQGKAQEAFEHVRKTLVLSR